MSWKASVGDSGQEADLFTVGDAIAMVSEGGLYCLDARTGKRRGVNEQVTSADAVASDGRGLFALDDADIEKARIVPVNLTTGAFGTPIAEIRHLSAERMRLLGAVGRSLILEGETRDGWQRIAVNSRTGKELWRRPMTDPGNEDITATAMGSSLIRSDGERVSLIDARDGSTRWTTKIPEKESGGLSPGARHSFSADHLFIGTWQLLALRLSDGELAWSFGKGRKFGASYEPGAQHYGPPVVKDGVVYAMERVNGLVAVDAGSGRLLWEEKGDDALAYDFSATPAVSERYFYASPNNDSQWIAAIDLRTHRVAWTFSSPWGDVGGLSPAITALPGARRTVVVRAASVCAVPLE